MGWSWALHWCQQIHSRILVRAGIEEGMILNDARPIPEPRRGLLGHVIYVDNYICLAEEPGVAERYTRLAHKALTEAGLPVHEECYESNGGE
eukprot:4749942-Amphidinium_carterae.1